MLYYLIAAGLVAHTYFWGAGLALLILPWRWRRWRWAFAPGLGLALQSAVVWAGAHTALPGTDSYAWWSELLPLILLGTALTWQIRRFGARVFHVYIRPPALTVAGIMVLAGWFLLSPMAAAGRGVTSSSLGSCDHADYAAGARVLAEFSQYDRTGMLGLTEVTHIGTADYFFDFWLRLNHFTPSALIAHNSTILGLEVYRLVSVTAAVFLLLNIPLVFLLARIVARLTTGVALFVAALYALSPLSAYAVHQGALGQLLAAQGIALLVVTIAILFRKAEGGRPLWRLGLVMVAAFWLLAGSYNFILVVCLAQAGLWLLGRILCGSPRGPLVRAVGMIAAALATCMLLFWPRFSGIFERFHLFSGHDFGWPVPLVTAEGWLGLVRNTHLEGYVGPGRWLLLGALAAGWTVWLIYAWRRERTTAVAAAAMVLPVAAGCAILAWASLRRANASYDDFKLLSVFYPGLLAGLCAGLVLGGRSLRGWGTMIFMAVILACNLVRAEEFRERMKHPPLRVDRNLSVLGRIENMPNVSSVNVRVGFYWARLWVDAFLLRKPHYFEEATYEGRNVTPLRGEWDLRYTLLRVLPATPADMIDLGRNFYLVRPATVKSLEATFGPGWHATERFGTNRWRWTSGAGRIVLNNATAAPVPVSIRFMVVGVGQGDRFEVECNGRPMLNITLGLEPDWTDPIQLTLPPGPTVLILSPGKQNHSAVPDDERKLGVALHQMELTLQRGP
jgi:hypothetical protein